MTDMPTRDTTGNCEGECRDRVKEVAEELQAKIAAEPYDTPIEKSPEWLRKRKTQPGAFGGRM